MALVYFKALSDETRLRLVHILLHYELSVNELVRILGMGQSRVSRHLKILPAAGLLTSRRDGLWVFYAATRCGEASDFLQAMGPFLHTDTAMREDLAMAAQILEERALKTRQFFNAIAEDWDELNREVLEDFDLPAAVLAAVPEGCRVAVDLGCGTGAVLERTFSPTDKYPRAHIETKEMQYLYNDGELYYFMDPETYELEPIDESMLSDSFRFVKENMICTVSSYKGKVFAVDPPTFVELTITEPDPGFAGNTATNATKPATLETGAVIKVPLFIEPGEKIIVDTRTGEYASRA